MNPLKLWICYMLDISARYIHICTVPPVATSPKKKGSHQDENNPVHSLKPFKYYIHVAPPSDINIHMLRVLAVAMNEISAYDVRNVTSSVHVVSCGIFGWSSSYCKPK